MSATHLHIVVNHLPFAFALVALLTLLVGLIGRNASIKKLSLGFLVLVAVAAATAYFTGKNADIFEEGAEPRVERHEEMAQTTWIVSIVGGVFGLAGLAFAKRMQEVPSAFVWLALAVLLFEMYLFARTSNLGGQITHSETRYDSFSKLLNPD